MGALQRLAQTNAPRAVVLVRLVTGWIFLSEGIQKFLYPQQLGVGRFVRIGIPAPEVLAPFVGTVEIVCGTLLVIGLITRLASAVLAINISVALFTTKLPILWNEGFWSAAHESRTDLAMLFCCGFLLIAGAGGLSMDRFL